ncbi:hypothetical protein FQA18_16280, partial [Haloferax volcanii]
LRTSAGLLPIRGPRLLRGGPRDPEKGSGSDEQLVREVRQLRDEVRDVNRELRRIADALEDRD